MKLLFITKYISMISNFKFKVIKDLCLFLIFICYVLCFLFVFGLITKVLVIFVMFIARYIILLFSNVVK